MPSLSRLLGRKSKTNDGNLLPPSDDGALSRNAALLSIDGARRPSRPRSFDRSSVPSSPDAHATQKRESCTYNAEHVENLAAELEAVPAAASDFLHIPSPNLWHRAYERLRREKAQLFSDYEELLSKHESLDLSATVGSLATPLDRQQKLQQVTKQGLQRLAESRAKYTVAGVEFVVIEQLAQVSPLIIKFKDFIANAIKASPEASVVWAGLSVLLPLFTNPSIVESTNKVGFSYVASRMGFYTGIEALFWPRSLQIPQDLRETLEECLVRLYATIINFYVECCMRFYRSWVLRTARDMIKYDDWDALLKSVTDEEAAVMARFQTINDAAIRNGIEQLRDVATHTFDVLQQQIAIATQHLEATKEHVAIARQQLVVAQGLDQRLASIAQPISVSSINKIALNINVVSEAQYDSADTANDAKCLASTRTSIRRRLMSWAKSSDGPNIFWLSGPAGTGKSTIARTVADSLALENSLAAGYFFKRGNQSRNGISQVLSTLTNQIITNIPGLRVCVAESLGSLDSDSLEKKSLGAQFNLLLATPLQALQAAPGHYKTQVIIIDALDESTEPHHAASLLRCLCKLSHTEPRFNILVTSRSTTQLEEQFAAVADMGLEYEVLRLQEAFADETKQDIETYLRSMFAQVRRRRRIKRDPWPEEKDIQLLISRAINPAPLFVYASSLFRFIDGRSSPVSQLDKWLRVSSTSSDQMHEIYGPILSDAFLYFHDDQLLNAKCILQTVILAATPVSALDLSDLLCLDIDDIHEVLRQFHAVLVQSENSHAPISLHHKSFSDYLLAESVCQPGQYHIDLVGAHESLARSCLTRLDRDLRRDMLNLGDLTVSKTSVSEPSLQIITGGMRYACKYWTQHAIHAKLLTSDASAVESFLRKHFLHWLECLIWVNDFTKAASYIISLEKEALASMGSASHFLLFLGDAQHFIPALNEFIFRYPLQLYSTALLFSPTLCRIRNEFWHERSPEVPESDGMPAEWDMGLQILQPASSLDMLCYSSDGMLLAAVYAEKQLIIYDTVSGIDTQTITSAGQIDAVVFSPDSKTIAALIRDGSMYFWDVRSGLLTRLLENCPNLLTRFTDQNRAARVSHQHLSFPDDGLAWDVATWQETHIVPRLQRQNMLALKGEFIQRYNNTDRWFQVFSDDGTLVASPTADRSIVVWDSRTGRLKTKLSKHMFDIEVIYISPCHSMLASGSTRFGAGDIWQELLVWDLVTGKMIADLKGHSELCPMFLSPIWFVQRKMAFCLVSFDGLYLWNVHARTLTSVEPKGLPPTHLVITANESHCAVGLSQQHLQIFPCPWNNVEDGNHGSSEVKVATSKGNVSTLSVSRKGIVALIYQDRVEFRELVTGKQLFEDRCCIALGISEAVFSADGERVVYPNSHATIIVRDTTRFSLLFRCTVGVLEESPDIDVFAPALSPSGSLLACKSRSIPLTVWDVDAGRIFDSVEGTENRAVSCRFSPRGNALTYTEDNGSYPGGRESGNGKTIYLELQHKHLQFRWNADHCKALSFSTDGSRLLVCPLVAPNGSMKVLSTKTGSVLFSFLLDRDMTDLAWSPITTEMLPTYSARYVRSLVGYLDIQSGQLNINPPTIMKGNLFVRDGWLTTDNKRILLITKRFSYFKRSVRIWQNRLLFITGGSVVQIIVPC